MKKPLCDCGAAVRDGYHRTSCPANDAAAFAAASKIVGPEYAADFVKTYKLAAELLEHMLYAAAHLNAAAHVGGLQHGETGAEKVERRLQAVGETFTKEFQDAVSALLLSPARPLECDRCHGPAAVYVSIDQSISADMSEEACLFLCAQHGSELRELAKKCQLTTKKRTDPWLEDEARIGIWPEPDERGFPANAEAPEELRACQGCADHIVETFKGED